MSACGHDPALRLAEAWQRGFPLCPRPYDEIGRAHDLTADETIELFSELAQRGALARIGAAVRPNTIGASTLAALSAPAASFGEVAAMVSAEPSVNHNYEREHALNLWFVVTGSDRSAVGATLDRIAAATGCAVYDLPLERAYHIDLGFCLEGRRRRHGEASAPCRAPAFDRLDQEILGALGEGLAFVARPYIRLATAAGCTEEEVISRLKRLVSCGVISRFGCILRHRRIGFTANAMAVWNVPDHRVDGLGERLAERDAVTLCYRRARRLPDWPYNLFAMVHGRERGAVEREIAAAAQSAGLSDFPAAVLFSRRCFKQQGARYEVGAKAAEVAA